MLYVQHADQIPTETRIPCRRPTLVATADRQPVACRPRLSQLSPQSLHSPELPRLSFRGEAPSYVLYCRQQGRRFSLYVPEELVPQVQRWLDNGRALQELLYQAAPRYVQALKRERDKASKKAED